jgi:peroxiredoxin Q/BCP
MPRFRAATDQGAFTDRSIAGQPAVIYFYPKDDTPGCTREACDFRDSLPKFNRLKTHVYGVSRDSLSKHANFARKYQLPFTLVSDEHGSMCEAFGVWVEKALYGKKYMGIERSTFLIGSDGTVRAVWRKVKVDGHIEDVLATIKDAKNTL